MAKKVKKSKASRRKKSKVLDEAVGMQPVPGKKDKAKRKKKKRNKQSPSMLIKAVIVATPIEESSWNFAMEWSKLFPKVEKKSRKAKRSSKAKKKKKVKKKKKKKKKKKERTLIIDLESMSNSSDESEKPKKSQPVQLHEVMSKQEVKKEGKLINDSESDDSSEDQRLESPSKRHVAVTVKPRTSSDNEFEKKMAEIESTINRTRPDSDDSDSDIPAKNFKKAGLESKPRSDDSSDGESSGCKTPPAKKAARPASIEITDSDNVDNSSGDNSEKAPSVEGTISDASNSKSNVEMKPAGSQVKRKNQFRDRSDSKRRRPCDQSGLVAQKIDLKGKTRRVFVGNLNYNIDDEKLKEFFEDIGEITDIFWLNDRETGDFKGAGFVTFATMEAATKAVEEKQGRELMCRPVKMDWTQERKGSGSKKSSSRTPDWVNNPLSKRPENCTTVFLGNLDFNITEADVRNHFKDCGKLKSVRWVEKEGDFKGAGFAEFESVDGADNAVKLCGKEIVGRAARVDYAKSRPRN